MSSTPFQLGVPIVDEVPPKDGTYILRTKDFSEVQKAIGLLARQLRKSDLIMIHRIGYRPDHPIPLSKLFTEVKVACGKAEAWMNYSYMTIGWSNIICGDKT